MRLASLGMTRLETSVSDEYPGDQDLGDVRVFLTRLAA